MHWIQLLLETNASESEHLEALLQDLGALSVTLTDAADQPLFEPGPGDTPLWNNIRLTGLFNATEDVTEIEAALSNYYSPRQARYKLEILEDKDWVKEWMDQFKPIRFSDNLWICPSWLKQPDPKAINIILDPGLAFGTGTHPTTALCLEWLSHQVEQDYTLTDYGCGSGVLAIASLLLGCKRAWAIDIDPQALQATRDNARKNTIDEQSLQVSLPQDHSKTVTDILIANILAGPLTDLAPELSSLVKTGGKLALSGVLVSQADEILAAYNSDFIFDTAAERDGWVLLSATKR